MRPRFLALLLVLASSLSRANTVVTLGTVAQFSGPDDPNLDLTGQFDYAINFSTDDPIRTVKGLQFKPDNQAIPGATLVGPQQVTPWQTKPEYGASVDANALEDIMHDIKWADAGSGQKLMATLAVTAGITYKLQILISGNNPENRQWDIRINGQNAVDEITSLGVRPGQSYAVNRSTVYSYEFTPATGTLTVEMGNFFGGNDGGDRNPIWQALTLERVFIPPTPENISLTPAQFFPSQLAYIGNFAVTDLKSGVAHTLALVSGTGSTDNTKFTLTGGQLLPQPFNFNAETPGTVYSIRVRATDNTDAARFLEKPFNVTLEQPHAPTAVVSNASSISSGLITGQTVAQLSATDADTFDRHAFALAPGTGSDNNNLFTVAGNELRLASAMPPGLTSVSFRLRAIDLSGLTVETAFTLPVTEPRIRINEVLAVSTANSRPLDENSQPQDWIELYNEQSQPVNLQGWHLTDDSDDLAKWTFPARTIPPNGYMIVFASGTGATPATGPVHTNFALSQDGETLMLVRPDGVIASDVDPPSLYPNVTWGVRGGGTETGHLRTATPGAANSQIAASGANTVSFSKAHSFNTASFPLTLTAAVAGSTIRYTLDGNAPTTTTGTVYSAPINITPTVGTAKSGVRIVRAIATHPDAAWSPVATQTYFFINGTANPNTDGVIGQTSFVSTIKNHATYGPLMDDALLSLPTVSLVINNTPSGIPFSETESSLELIDPQGAEAGFTIPAGVLRTGTSSLSYAKGSMSARFRGEYGATRLSYPMFANHPYDALGAATDFQEIRLRSGSHDTHSWLGTAENPPVPYGSPSVTRSGDAQFVRNIFLDDVEFLMGQPSKHGRMVHMYINGVYYGMYCILEHPDDDYMASYYPGSNEDYHYTGGGTTGSVHGTETWSTIWNQMKSSLGNYTQAKRWVDVTSLADYMVLSYWAGNDWDWSTTHNWSAAGPRLPDRGGWKFFQQDQDISLQDVNANCTDQGVPDGVFNSLMNHADFKVLYRDRIYRHCFNDGVLTPAKAAQYYNYRVNEIFTAIVSETARWQPGSSVGPLPWDRDGEFTVEWNYLKNTYFPQRTTNLMNQFRARGWYPVDAPVMSPRGGAVASGAQAVLTAPTGTIYYTLDGSDPRLPGGGVNPAALSSNATLATVTMVEAYDDRAGKGASWKYFVGNTDLGTAWQTVSYDDSAWPQGPVEAGYGDSDEITSVGWVDVDPVTPGDQRNLTTYFRHTFNIANPAAVTGLSIRLKRDDGAVVYINGREVMRSAMQLGEITFTTPGNNGVSVTDDGNTWFSQGLIPSQYTLNTGANTVAVEIHNAVGTSGDISFDFELNATVSTTPSPIIINGPTTLKARVLVGAEWSPVNEASFVLTGTQPAATNNLTLSEIHYNPEGTGQGDNEFLEFKNTSTAPVDVSGVEIGGAVEFTFPANSVLAPGEHIVVVKDAALFDARYRTATSPWYHAGIRVAGAWSGSLSNGGETIVVMAANRAPVYTFAYSDNGAWPGRADGNGSSLELSDPGAAPSALPEKATWLGTASSWRPSAEFHGSPGYAGSGPDQRIAINEVLSASVAPGVDFIELLNISGVPQNPGGWFLSDSSDDYRKYRLPAGTTMAAGDYLVLTENQFANAADAGCVVPFSLSSAGDDVFLVEADASGNLLRFADRVEFSAAPGGMTFGRAPNGTGSFDLMRGTTQGAANTAAIPQYAAWVTSGFPEGATAADTALDADPDRDGLTNVVEFAFKLPPLVPNGSPLTTQPAANGSPLQIHFAVRNDIPGLTARLDVSSSLSSWDTTESLIERVSEVAQPDGTNAVTARFKTTPAPPSRSYLRLVIGL
ncbi:MAG TPA: lamin tail domain-containing protein [Verrucomicrobiales bacterium]|nr:lamin tail domain-containing protein [Verrucomicrobiales bacterium]